MPCRRATPDAEVVVRNASSTIARFSSRDHRRRVSAVITNRSKVSGPDMGTTQVQSVTHRHSTPDPRASPTQRKAAITGRLQN
jgi:hypothetical protein